MMRMVEALFVVVLVTGAMVGVINNTFIPAPIEKSSKGLEDTGISILQSLDQDYSLSYAAFSEEPSSPEAIRLSIESVLPPNMVYRITVQSIDESTGIIEYEPVWETDNFDGTPPTGSKTVTYTVTNPKVTMESGKGVISVGGKPVNLYILNCQDAYSWYPPKVGLEDLGHNIGGILEPWFATEPTYVGTIAELTTLIEIPSGPKDVDDPRNNAIVLNPLGGATPVPIEANTDTKVTLANAVGHAARYWNWTYMCYFGEPEVYFNAPTDGWSGLKMDEDKTLMNILSGLDNQGIVTPSEDPQKPSTVPPEYTDRAKYYYSYYGINPGSTPQELAWDFKEQVKTQYHLVQKEDVFVPTGGLSGNVYAHIPGSDVEGSIFLLGLTQTPDERITAIGILLYYKPGLYRLDFLEQDTIRFVTLTLAQMGAE
jgi:hypothetical protein